MHRFARAFELAVSYFGIAVLLMLLAATNSVPTSFAQATASNTACVAPTFYSLTVTSASLNTPWSLPLLSTIDGTYAPKVTATGLPPGIVLDDQKTTLTAGGSVLHNWVLNGAPTQLGTYTINVTAQNSCGGASTIVTLPINNIQTAQGTVPCPTGTTGTYPNCQSSTAAKVSFDQSSLAATTPNPTITGTSNSSTVNLSARSSAGVMTTSGNVPVSGGRWSAPLSNLMTGIYSLFLYDGNGTLLIPGSLVVALPGGSTTNTDPSSIPTAHVNVQNGVVIPNTPVSNPNTSSQCLYLNRALQFGSRGTDVYNLQIFLVRQGLLSQSSVSGYFGAQTRAAVQQFQVQQGIASYGSESTTGFGMVGGRTRVAIASNCGGQITQPPVQHLTCALPVIPPCPGGSSVSLGVDQNGCSRGYTCKQSLISTCPAIGMPTCTHGTVTSLGIDQNGCSLGYQCQQVSCPIVQQITCAPGQTIVTGPDSNGCATVSYCSGTATPSITVNTSSSLFTQGNSLGISWNVQNAPDNSAVALFIQPSGGSYAQPITAGLSTNGSFTYQIPSISGVNTGFPALGCLPDAPLAYCGTFISQNGPNFQIIAKVYTPANAIVGGMISPTPAQTPNYVGSAQTNVTIYPAPTPPPANASLSASPSSGNPPLSVVFYPTGLSAGFTYYIDYGDGNSSGTIAGPCAGSNCYMLNSIALAPQHTYTSAGSYNVTLRVSNTPVGTTNLFPGSVVANTTVTVSGTSAGASLQASPSSGSPLSVTFTGSMPGTSYTLDFGDGSQPVSMFTNVDCAIGFSNCAANFVSSVNQTHTYTSAGTYRPTLTGNNGQIAATTILVTGGRGGGSAAFNVTQSSGTGSVMFGGNAGVGCNGGNFTLDYGDGQSDFVAIPADSCNGGFRQAHVYSPGTYTATLYTQSNFSSKVIGTVTITVSGI